MNVGKIVRTPEEIDRVYQWAQEGAAEGGRYSGQNFEEGIIELIDWLYGNSNHAPDED